MALTFWRRSKGPRELSSDLRDAVVSRLKLDPADLDGLTCIEQRGPFAGRPVVHFRLYDPAALNGSVSNVARYDDLGAEPQAVRFEGWVEKGGSMYVSDRRSPTGDVPGT